MAEVNKSKLQLRSGLNINGDKTPSPVTKLLINHGKPNFTIQRSPKAQNGNVNPLSPISTTTTSDEFVLKSTKFNGVFKPSNISAATKEVLKQNGSCTSNGNDNEAAKVVLRRTKVVQPELREGEDGNVPEFILRQRRIQERLANQNILDFESRRSGYFTQVMISPTSPNRQSFVETMASPAIKPGLEIPPPAQEEEVNNEEVQQEQHEIVESVKSESSVFAEPVVLNGQIEEEEEEEVAKAIEEVNKAVEGEDDDKTDEEHFEKSEQTVQPTNEAKALEKPEAKAVVETAEEVVTAVVTSALEVVQEEQQQQNSKVEKTSNEPKLNGFVEEHLQNGHSNGEATANEITISHTNGLHDTSLATTHAIEEKSINFEPKTVVSFSQELGNDVNKYPDTVKVLKENETTEIDSDLKELTKLKFEIKADNKDIEVKPVLITESISN